MKHITEVSFENMVILPPGPGKCKICAGAHDPAQPHNKDSLYYRMKFRQRHGRYPNWTDAIEHCTALAKARFVATEVSACPVWHSYEVASELELGGFTRTATDRERDDDKPEWAGRSLPQPFPSTNEKSRLAGDNASLGKHCRRTTQR